MTRIGRRGRVRGRLRLDGGVGAMGSGCVARSRLLGDQVLRPLQVDRARLGVLAARLERAAGHAVVREVAARVRGNASYAPVLGRLMQKMLQG